LRRRWIRCAAGIAAACAAVVQPALPARADTPPAVPLGLEAPEGHKLFRVDHAVGTQNYICLPSTSETGPEFAWQLVGPQATLFNERRQQTATHFFSVSPIETDVLRPTWQDSRDTSAIWGAKVEESSDPTYVDPDAISWLLLRALVRDTGPNGGRRMTRTSYLQRINTTGGKAPATGCAAAEDVGHRAIVPYTADYVFYRSIAPEA
jgi:hypothetical protein